MYPGRLYGSDVYLVMAVLFIVFVGPPVAAAWVTWAARAPRRLLFIPWTLLVLSIAWFWRHSGSYLKLWYALCLIWGIVATAWGKRRPSGKSSRSPAREPAEGHGGSDSTPVER